MPKKKQSRPASLKKLTTVREAVEKLLEDRRKTLWTLREIANRLGCCEVAAMTALAQIRKETHHAFVQKVMPIKSKTPNARFGNRCMHYGFA